ncbi:alpha/beta hydrolase family protein [Dyadobacter fermentans]|jgi:pimeloyl-ACP methyl ester carboxylesterase|uniref:alpha/beta hydrolase family protein n=1 Tax=Dyadobacter fermentans TaxID=94254 RepID=UPI001CBBFE2F|nr:lipase family protein [Dyadobacter fermentans]MBZ1356737.1 lipase family protein [Dyadobacter fermentans]
MQKSTTSVLLHKLSFLLLWSLLVLNSCKDDDTKLVPPTEENVYLKESTPITSLSKAQIIQKTGNLSGLVAAYVKNDIKVYKITYKTKNTDGTDITASGALIIPVVAGPVSMISVQHGTITDIGDAPSLFRDGSEGSSFGSLFGSMGYIIAYPDYIGYGASDNLPHPYEHRASLASASLDMLRAAKEYLRGQKEVKWDEKLYVAGYSEGGFATMSLQRKIEEEASSEFNLRASSCGAGAYDKTAFMKHIINDKTDGIAGYNSLYLWVLLTYDNIYKLNKPASYYFTEKYAAKIAASGRNVAIAESFHLALNDSFKKALNDGTDKGFIDAIADNDVYNFKPKTPTQLYHGTKDPLVFFFNSENAYNAMQKLGATNVTFIKVTDGTHSSSILPFLLGTQAFFAETP